MKFAAVGAPSTPGDDGIHADGLRRVAAPNWWLGARSAVELNASRSLPRARSGRNHSQARGTCRKRLRAARSRDQLLKNLSLSFTCKLSSFCRSNTCSVLCRSRVHLGSTSGPPRVHFGSTSGPPRCHNKTELSPWKRDTRVFHLRP